MERKDCSNFKMIREENLDKILKTSVQNINYALS